MAVKTYTFETAPLAAQRAFEKLKPVFREITAPCWIAGGCIRDLCLYGEHHTDVDVFFRTTTDCEVAKDDIAGVIDDGVNPSGNTSSGVSKLILKNDSVYKYQVPRLGQVDLVRILQKSPEETIAHFDFTVCAAAVDRQGNFYCDERFFEDLLARRLVVIDATSAPLATMRRLQKYRDKGYSICQGGLLEIAKAVQAADLSKPQTFYVD